MKPVRSRLHRQFCIFSVLASLGTASSPAAHFYLSPSGEDSNPGTREAPFATLERARAAARNNDNSIVTLMPGRYHRRTTFELNETDSKTSYKGNNATITGSIQIPNTSVSPVKDPSTLERIPEATREHLMEIDLRALGINDFGSIGPRGFRRPYQPAPIELFINEVPLRIAQWPNPGEAGIPIGKVLDKGPITRKGERPNRGGSFTFSTTRPEAWRKAKDIWLTGIFSVGWADNTVQVDSINLEDSTITTKHAHMYGFGTGKPWNTWVALNLLEEIDQPGEFVAERSSGKLYFYPPDSTDLSNSLIEVSHLQTPLITIEGGQQIILDNLEIGHSRGMGIYIERGTGNRIQNCTLKNLGMVAVSMGKGVKADTEYRHNFTGQAESRILGSWHEHLYDNPTFNREAGTNHGIINCEIYNIGSGAISLGGGDRKTLTPANNFVENCHIYNFNRWDRTYRGAINIDGVGQTITHNHIHSAPGVAIYLHGNNHLIEYNEIHNVMTEGDDMGAFYMGRDPSERGNLIRYNYWHHIGNQHATYALYFDDYGGDGSHVYGNVFYRAGSLATIFINHGSDILVENNLFIDCSEAFRMNGNIPFPEALFQNRLSQVGYDQSIWSRAYPGFENYFHVPRRRNVIRRNNLILSVDDPKLTDGSQQNFNLTPEATNALVDFPPIPFDKMGRHTSTN